MNNEELIELLKPCEKLCRDCGAKCCYSKKDGKACVYLKEGKCTKRREFCLLIYCKKMEKEYPQITDKLKAELLRRYPACKELGITPLYRWDDM